MPLFRKRRYAGSYYRSRMGSAVRKARPYFRAKRTTLGKRLGASTGNTYAPSSASSRAAGYDLTSATACIPRLVS